MDVRKRCSAVIGRVVFIGFCVQIILGFLWMCNAFAGMDNFGEGIVCVGQILLFGVVLSRMIPEKAIVKKLFRVMAVESFPMIIQTLMRPNTRILLAALLLLGWQIWQKRKKAAWVFVLASVVMGYLMAPERELLAIAGSRMVWTTLYHDYQVSEEEVQERLGYWVTINSTYEATGIEKVLIPSLRERYTKKETREIINLLIRTAWTNHKNQIVKEILWDEAGYLLPPVVVPMQLQHRAYDSGTGLNYRQFLQPSPLLAKYVMGYGNNWFVLAGILGLLRIFLAGGYKREKGSLWYILITAGGMSLWYTFSTAGRMDYQNAVYILSLWILWMTENVNCWQEAAEDVA